MRNTVVAIYDEYRFSAPIEYTLDLIFSVYGITSQTIPLQKLLPGSSDLSEKLVVSYGRIKPKIAASRQIHIYASRFFGANYLKPDSMPCTPLARHKSLPVIYQGEGDLDGWVRRSENLIETNIDIIASCFFMLSRYEEVVQSVRDQHDRFPATASLAFREGFLDRPLVNEYLELLWSWIHSAMPHLKRKPLWPDNKAFAVCVSHDVDSIKRYSALPPACTVADLALKQKQLGEAYALGLDYLATRLGLKRDPFDTFDYMLNMEQRNNIRSSFYFMGGGSAPCDARYSISQPQVQQLIKRIEDKNCEVGLHGSYWSYDRKDIMKKEKANLGSVVVNSCYGCRQHYLRWRTPETWRAQEESGLQYDTTLAFADCTGFRCGYCLPFQPFDVLDNRKLNIWELPLIVMEGSLHDTQYEGLNSEEAYKKILSLAEKVQLVGGVFTLLWHNSSFDAVNRWEGWQQVYEKIIDYIGCQDAWAVPGRELVSWWSSHLDEVKEHV